MKTTFKLIGIMFMLSFGIFLLPQSCKKEPIIDPVKPDSQSTEITEIPADSNGDGFVTGTDDLNGDGLVDQLDQKILSIVTDGLGEYKARLAEMSLVPDFNTLERCQSGAGDRAPVIVYALQLLTPNGQLIGYLFWVIDLNSFQVISYGLQQLTGGAVNFFDSNSTSVMQINVTTMQVVTTTTTTTTTGGGFWHCMAGCIVDHLGSGPIGSIVATTCKSCIISPGALTCGACLAGLGYVSGLCAWNCW